MGRHAGAPVGQDMVTASPGFQAGVTERSAMGEIRAWGTRSVRSHPLQSLETVGGQTMLGVRTLQYFFIDLFTGRFQFAEFVRQAAFMAGTSVVPTLLVTIPVGVTLSIQFGVLAGQVGAESLAGAANGLVVIRQGAPLVAAILLAAAVGSAVSADLGSRTMREEVDAMEVMGVSVIRRLVVPRFAAVIVVGVGLTGLATCAGFFVGYMFNVYMQNGTPGSFVATFASFASTRRLTALRRPTAKAAAASSELPEGQLDHITIIGLYFGLE
jgi:phospholipid/cholesterol/gamma-HCH transport system permease protein